MITKFSVFLFLFVAFSAKNREKEILRPKSTKLLKKDILQLVEELSEPRDAMKMRMINEHWSKVKVTGDLNLFPNESSIKVWRNMESNVVFWDDPEQLILVEDRERINMCLQTTNTVEMSNCLFYMIFVEIEYSGVRTSSFFKAILDFIAENLYMSKEKLREISAQNYINPFVQAAKLDSLKLVSKLFQIDPRIVNTGTAEYCTALHFAVSTSCCKFLLQHGANVDAVSLCNTTPLMMASFCGFDEIVENLLEYNANTEMKSQGEGTISATALDFARHKNHQRCIDLIEAHKNKLGLLTKIKNILFATPSNFLPPIVRIAIMRYPQLFLAIYPRLYLTSLFFIV